MKRIIIAGVPATGKTFMGDYMENNLGFKHFDVENMKEEDAREINIRNLFCEVNIDQFIKEIGSDSDIVITWGFVCDDQRSLSIIKKLQENGFKFIWFFAEESLARIAFLKRKEEENWGNIDDFNTQMNRIKKLDLNIFNDYVIIETMNDNGRKKESEIVTEILEAIKI
jgi:shikimate kinase